MNYAEATHLDLQGNCAFGDAGGPHGYGCWGGGDGCAVDQLVYVSKCAGVQAECDVLCVLTRIVVDVSWGRSSTTAECLVRNFDVVFR